MAEAGRVALLRLYATHGIKWVTISTEEIHRLRIRFFLTLGVILSRKDTLVAT
jgi:hypothetical protein